MITYSIETNKITVIGEGAGNPGGDADHAYGFTDIYNADVAGGWGKVLKQGTNQFLFNAGIVIGDANTETYFADTKKEIVFPADLVIATVGGYQHMVHLTKNSHFRLGILYSDVRKETGGGCTIVDLHTGLTFPIGDGAGVGVPPIEAEIYGCSFIGTGRQLFSIVQATNQSKCYNTIFSDKFEVGGYKVNFYNVILTDAAYGFSRVQGNMDKITIMKITANGLYSHPIGESSSTFKNVIMKNVGVPFRFYSGCSLDQYLINPDFDVWNITFTGSVTAKLYRQYEFDLKVTDKDGNNINGATVKIWDKDDNLVVDTTTASGVIAEQIITRGYYNSSNGSILQDASPHKLTISKAGYQTYSKKFTLDSKIDWAIRLKRSVVNIDQEVLL